MSPKKSAVRALVALAVTAVTVGLAGCSDAQGEAADTDEAEISSPAGAFGPALFRNDFYTYLKSEGHLTEDQVRQLVFMPTAGVIDPKVTVNPDRPLDAHDNAFRGIRPTDLYNAGLREPLVVKRHPTSPDLEGELRHRPIHIVIVPGIFGEFIPVSPFEEIFQTGGTAKLDFEAKVDALEASGDPADKERVTDKQYSVAALADVAKSLKSTLRVGSIDDADGKPLVTVTYLKPELGSLETFGTLDENADYYLPRLDKYFQLMGVPSHLYVMGYSRGMATALNLVSRAQAEHASWAPKLKGVIGLAGVIYGSQLADATTAPGPQHDMLATMQDFVDNELESCTEATPSAWLVTKNAGHWTAFSGRMALLGTKLGNHNAELQREGISTALADVGKFVTFAKRALLGDPNRVFDAEGADDSIAAGVLHLSSPNAEYCQNIERFKRTATQIMKGVATLTTDSRVEWWRTHTLPTNVRYYAITGTMGDATPEGALPSPLVKTPLAYDPQSVDYRNLRGNYYDLLAASGTQLQDSQVPVQRGRFWDDVDRALNPAQAPLKTYFMGTVGSSHWGLSFPRAFATHDGLEANPFPRTLLLKSIATFVAQVERRGG
jgi:hypothetical protein